MRPITTSIMLWLALPVLLNCGCGVGVREMAAPDIALQGAGATFPAPLYQRWGRDLLEQQSGVIINYDSVGSGAGVQQFIDEIVDFAASDQPLTDKEIAQVDRGVQLIPMTSGAIVLAYNLLDTDGKRVTSLRLSRNAYTSIYLGEITTWDDKAIAKHNPELTLPNTPIQVEYRLDSSGSTSTFTQHLSAVSETWRAGPGHGKQIIWPTGAGMPTDRGVARGVGQVPGSIGYVSYGLAILEDLPVASLENRAGEFVLPTVETIRTALDGLSTDRDGLRILITDPSKSGAYPIVTYSWLLCYQVYEDPEKLAFLKKLLAYGLEEGQQISEEMGYVPLPNEVTTWGLAMLDKITLPQSSDAATEMLTTENESPFSSSSPKSTNAGK